MPASFPEAVTQAVFLYRVHDCRVTRTRDFHTPTQNRRRGAANSNAVIIRAVGGAAPLKATRKEVPGSRSVTEPLS